MRTATSLLVAVLLCAPTGWGQTAAAQQDQQGERAERAQAAATPATAAEQSGAVPAAATMTLPAGTRIQVAAQRPHGPESAVGGTRVYLQTVSAVALEGRVVIPAKSGIYAEVGRRGEGREKRLVLRMNRLVYPNNYERNISGMVVSLPRVPSERWRFDAPSAGLCGATAGALIGIASKSGAGIAIGLIAGAIAGVVLQRATRRDPVWLAAGAAMEMVLDEALTLDVSRIV